ncbi:hypothetical protein K0M31_009022 [Melipona bicolor]|uniref:Uncharacterized protein n=1 Tax=Melipona bicolor TaxID=60889 RepID=A0AA40FNR8_9HYME|nr:hypothetical protein K0M31_009022 [Melipona bicolor]
MKAVFILFVSICIPPWCVSTASINEEPALNNHLDTTVTLNRIARQIDPFRIVDQLVSDVIQLPGRAVEQILHIIQSIFASIRSAVQSLLDSIQSLINNLALEINGTSSNTGGRRRRSDAASPLPDLLLNPLNNVRKMLSQLESTTTGEVDTIVNTAVQTALDFLSKQVIPLLHHILETLQNSNTLPSSVQSLIQSLEAVYFLLRMAGYVS